MAEDDETFTLNLSLVDPPDGVLLATPSAEATIEDDDELILSVTAVDQTVTEGEDAEFTVMPGDGKMSTAEVMVQYEVSGVDDDNDTDDKAADKEDYTPQSGTLTIPAGSSTGTILISATQDDVLEKAETFEVTLKNPVTAKGSVIVSGTGSSAMSKIPAHGTVAVSVTGPSGSVEEGDEAVFTLVLSGKVSEAVMVNYDVAGAERVTPSPLTIDAKETRRTFTVQTADNTVAEASKTVTVTLPQNQTLPSGVGRGTTTATATISDNDPLTVSLDGPDNVRGVTAPTYTVRLKVGAESGTGSATVEVDYQVDGERHTLFIDPGTSSEQIPNSSIDLTGKQVNDTLLVRLTNARTTAGTVRVGSPGQKRTTFVSTSTEIVSVADASPVSEGGNATFAVTSGSGADGVVVQYRVVPGSANSADYQAPSGRLTLDSSGDGTITVRVRTDDVVEAAEEFSVELTSENGTDVVLGTTTASATITANAKLMATMTRQPEAVLEGGSVTYVVSLSGKSSEDIVIDYTVEATTSGSDDDAEEADYTAPADARLRIPARQTTGTIVIQTVDDDLLEPAESFQVTLETARPTELIETPSATLTTTIRASDSPARVSVADVTVDEGETAMIEVTLSKIVSSDVRVTYALANVAPTSAADYDHTQQDLVFIPGETAKTIEIQTTQDTLAEDEEKFTVTLTLSNPPTGVEPGRTVATVTITDDALRATIEGPASVDEGDAAVYTVAVTGGTFGTGEDDQITVTWSTAESRASSDDFSPTGGTLDLSAEEPSATFTIQTEDDDIAELGEEIVVSLTAQTVVDGETEAVRTGAPARTMIVDNDGEVEVSIARDQGVVAEGQPATFTVTLTGAVAEALTLRYATVDGTATAGTDYTPAGAAAAVEIAAGEMSTTITVATAPPDGQDEIPDEIFSVRLLDDGLPEDVAIETPTASVRITDHEITRQRGHRAGRR